MAYPRPFVRVTVEGDFPTGTAKDIWRTTFKIPHGGAGVPDSATLLAFLTDLAPIVSAYHANTSVGAGSVCVLKSLSAANIGTDGKYLGGNLQETVRYTLPSIVTGSGNTIHPWSTAMCISMKSVIARGRGSRGRMYWPATSIPITAGEGLVSVTVVEAMAAAAKTMIDGINGKAATRLGANSHVSLMSQLGTGTEGTVTAVSVGRRVDHMESRENKLGEEHEWFDLASTRQIAAVTRKEQFESWANSTSS